MGGSCLEEDTVGFRSKVLSAWSAARKQSTIYLSLPVTRRTLAGELSARVILLHELSLSLEPIVLVPPVHTVAFNKRDYNAAER